MNDSHGILRLLRSSKFYTACVGTVLALLPIIFGAPDLTREQKLEQWRNFTLAASTLWAGVIVMNGVEDYAAKRDAPAGPGTPAVQVNTGSDAANVQAQPAGLAGLSPLNLPPNPPTWTSSNAPPPAGFQRTSTETP